MVAILKAAFSEKPTEIGPLGWLKARIRRKFPRPLGETLLRICYGPIREPDQSDLGYISEHAFCSANTMNRRDLLLAVLACAEGRSYTPAQIQKAMFLLTRQMPQLVQQGPGFAFQPYDFGPFDVTVYQEAGHLQRGGEAVIVPSGQGNWNTYAASGEGVVRGRQLLRGLVPQQRDFIRKVSEWVRAQSFNSLVKSIYDAYPEMKVNSIFRG